MTEELPQTNASPVRAPDGTAFELHGPADGDAVVLIHGLGLCRRLWDPTLGSLTGRYQVITYDLYGHGESVPPAGTASLRLYGDQIAGLLDHVGIERAHVVGFSIGGMINRRFALDHGERLRSLVILNSPHDRGEHGQQAVEERAKTVREQGAMSTMDAALVRWFTPGHLEKHPEHETAVRTWRDQVDPEGYAQATWVLAHGVRELIRPTPPVASPTLVMTGEHDTGSTPAMAYAIADEIDGAETIIVDRLQHLGLLEVPELFMRPIADFLERNPS